MDAQINHDILATGNGSAVTIGARKIAGSTDWKVALVSRRYGDEEGQVSFTLGPAECMELARLFVQLANMSGYSRRLR